MLNQSIISEVEKVGDFDEDLPEYNYSKINVLPSRRNPNEIGTVFFNGKTFGRSEYHDPEYNIKVKFNGPLGEFKFDSRIVRYNGNSPYVFGNDLNHSDYYKLLPLMAPTKTQVSSDNITSSSDNITSSSDKVISDNKLIIDQYKTQVQDTLNGLGSWITNKTGLHLSKTIDDILDPKKSELSESEIKDNINGAQILLVNGKISQKSYDYFVEHISDKKLVYDESGNWLPINKLNANYVEVSKLLTDLLFDSYLSNKDQLSKEILFKLIYEKNIREIEHILLKNKGHLIELLNSYKGADDLINKLSVKYTSDIITLSKIGEETENKAVAFLEKNDWEEVYQGGNGDFIDMLFSVDLIFRNDTGLWTFQVKSSKKGGEKFIQDVKKNRKKYGAVDYLIYPIYPMNDKFKIYNLRTGKYE
jgi:hypothetical protein